MTCDLRISARRRRFEGRAYRDGVLVSRELCESEEDAAAFVETREQEPGIECEVDDLSVRSHNVEVFEVEPTDVDEYPTVAERGTPAERS